MATWAYLDSYLSSIPAAQRQNLMNLIYGQVLSGQVTTTGQYQAELNSLLAQLSTGLPAPVFTQYIQPYQSITNSANYNAMETQAITALQTLYAECNLLDQAISDYQNVVEGNLDAIEATVTSLEAQVSALELLSANTDGYTSAVYGSFSEGNSFRLTRAQANSNTPFIVPSIGFIASTYDAIVVDNELILPETGTNTYSIGSASLQNFNPNPAVSGIVASSDLPVSGNPYDVSNLVLNDPTQYWAETVDISTLSQTSVSADLNIQLAGVQNISNIYINPFTMYPYQITDIQYTKNYESGVYYEMLDDVSQYPITIGTATNISFSAKSADSILLSISQNNYSALRYAISNSDNIISNLYNLTSNTATATPEATNPSTYAYAMSSIMTDLLNIGAETANQTSIVSVYEFLYGMKQIEFSQSAYDNEGLFVSQNYIIPNCAAIGLNTVDSLPVTTNQYNGTAIEYSVLVQYSDIVNGQSTSSGSLLQNILPANVTIVLGEILDGVNNTETQIWSATTRFAVNQTDNITVYQNGASLNGENAYTIATNSDNTITINILNAIIPDYITNTSVFTIDYTPAQSAYIVNLANHNSATINLQIFLRSITPDSSLTPSVLSYSMQFKSYTGS